MKKVAGIGGLVGASVLMIALPAFAGTVRATGTVQYAENGANGGTKLGLGGVRVKLLDDELIGSTVLRTGYTNASGQFDISANADDGIWQGKLDPFIRVELESDGGKLVVESEIFKINVTCSTGVRNETEGTIPFGNISCGGQNADAAAIYAHMRKAYEKFTQLTTQTSVPRHSGKAATLFPCVLAAGVPYTTEESVHWPYGYRAFKAAFHEFGHRIRHAQDGDFAHFLGDVAAYTYMQHHDLEKVTNEGFAFNEGWAEYNAAQSSTTSANTLNTWAMINGGANNIEGNVAAKLQKLSNNCGGFRRMWSTLQSGSFHKYSELANKLKNDFNANATLRTQFPSCVPNIVATLDAPESTDVPPAAYALGPTMSGAFAPGGQKASLADVTASINAWADAVKERANKLKTRNRAANNPKLKALGENLANERDAFERRAAQKLEKYVKASRLHDGSKAAMDQRRADNVAFMKDLFADRVQTIEKQIKAIDAEKAKVAKGPDAVILDKLKANADALLVLVKKAAQTGEADEELMPRCFSAPLEVTP